ncbi:MAG: hypothetical protein EXR72_21525 [Myxococcales bacterium]|nr:hypothetical protein [Myxococcales bacterium]
MPLAEIRIDEALWSAATPERRIEWRQALHDLLEEHVLAERSAPLHLNVRVAPHGHTLLEARTSDGVDVARVDLPGAALAPHFKEYFDICRDMGKLRESAHSPRLEALDIAKRIAHDEAAETLVDLCRPLGPDHATCRRLFTLLVTLHFDTTRLLLPHHRR